MANVECNPLPGELRLKGSVPSVILSAGIATATGLVAAESADQVFGLSLEAASAPLVETHATGSTWDGVCSTAKMYESVFGPVLDTIWYLAVWGWMSYFPAILDWLETDGLRWFLWLVGEARNLMS